ncbi:exoribonuclease R [Sphaerochaeta pleomorpha str. Grapes]|uniref:Exoribonuclease R n=2 Tax=Sphaerochaeta TaxID=399320 RepID=G8QSF2_SPHPG|nr:exoribonuclease R [Sphaerochaeta pleomorpha str. Grapes]
MNVSDDRKDRILLEKIAHQAMLDRGLAPDFSKSVLAELEAIKGPATYDSVPEMIDLRDRLWCSLDNDDSKDLDQLTAVETSDKGFAKILIAIADVDAVVKKQSAIDLHAQQNTTSVYTVPQVFPMLPEKLSTDITSLNFDRDRLSLVVEIDLADDGTVLSSSIYRAMVRNKARLSYTSVAAWLDGTGAMPVEIASVKGMEESLRLQDSIAQKMKLLRHQHGALVLETIEAKPVFSGDTLMNLVPDTRNRAKEIVEDFMIAANGVTSRFLTAKKFPSIRRIVTEPKRWDRIVKIAADKGTVLPKKPDSLALENFLIASQRAEPLRFPDLSLSVIKLLGSGEYIVQMPDQTGKGHFGLAVKNYTHSTAPNRRFPDLITQRLLKSAIAGIPSPYSVEELTSLAQHCNEAENAANKVERQVVKSAAAILLESRIGEQFDAIVTGAAAKGTWVRIFDPPLEGRLESGFEGLDIGDRLRVQLVSTDVNRGFIDFKRVR